MILVTGAAKRIGRGIALRLAREGARVAIHYHLGEPKRGRQRRNAATLRCFGPTWKGRRDRSGCLPKCSGISDSLDGLVNNAARFTRIDPLEITEADWDFIHSVNLKATFFCCQQAARRMLAGRRRAHREHQLAGRHPRLARSCALLRVEGRRDHLTRALAQAWAPKITVNSVAPGVIPFGEPDERVKRLIAKTPAGRAGTAERSPTRWCFS